MTVGVTIPNPKSPDWFEQLCAKRGWFIVDGMAWVRHVDEHARWFGTVKERTKAKPQGVRA